MIHLQDVSGAEIKREGLEFDLLWSAMFPGLHILSSFPMKPMPVAGPRKYLIFFFIKFTLCKFKQLFNLETQENRAYLPNASFLGNHTVADEQARWFHLHCISWTWGSCCISISRNSRCIMTHSIGWILWYAVVTLAMSHLVTLTDHLCEIGPWTTIFYVWTTFHLPDWDFKFEHRTEYYNCEFKLSCVLPVDE